MVRCVEAGLSKAAAARQFNTTAKTVAKWVERFGASGVDGLRDRPPSRFHCQAKQRLRDLYQTNTCLSIDWSCRPCEIGRLRERPARSRKRAVVHAAKGD